MLLMQKKKKKKKKPDPIFFNDGQKVSVIDTTEGRIYFLTCKNFGLRVQWP